MKMFQIHNELIERFVMVDGGDLGVEIHTNKQIIQILIGNGSSCCEQWGFLTTEDKLLDYVGARILSISLVDMDYNQHPLFAKMSCDNFGELWACFVDVETSVGKLQFALYNSHNGYYGHNVKIISNQLTHHTIL